VHLDSGGTRPDSVVGADSATPVPATTPRRGFRPYALRGASDLQLLIDSLGPAGVTTILKLNRIDLARARAGDTLLVPEAIDDELEFAPFPAAVSALDSVPRLIAVSQRVQAFGAYEHGKLVRWGPTSTGKAKTPTPNGLYFTNWKRKQTVSTDNDEWLLKWYFNFENARGISFHEYDLPGYPASHSCVRLLAADAEWIYSWARQWRLSKDAKSIVAYGTPVAVFGNYEYARPRPWRRVMDDVEAARVPAAELDSALSPHLTLIRERVRPDST
jgi:lipoprotein-anchoring transpeptidase ErfK/SrfK